MLISPMRIWTRLLSSEKPNGIFIVIHIICYHPERECQLIANSWTLIAVVRNFDDYCLHRIKNSVVWQIVINARIPFNLQVKAIPGYQSLFDCCYWTIWVISGESNHPENNTIMEKHCAVAWYSTVQRLMHAICIEGNDAQQGAMHWMILNACIG